MSKADVEPPLAQFQLTDATHSDTWRLLLTTNASFDEANRLPEAQLRRVFEKWWPDLDTELTAAMTAVRDAGASVPERPAGEKLDEILDAIRSLERRLTPQPTYEPASAADLRGHSETSRFGLGDLVRHPQFGLGVIQELTSFGADRKAVIDFRTVGRKKIVLRYAALVPASEEAVEQ